MKNSFCFIFGLILICSCGGKLSEEQRKKLHDGMKKNVIRKITDAQMMDEGFRIGRQISTQLGQTTDKKLLESLEKKYHVKIRPLFPGSTGYTEIEKMIIEAYVAGSGQVDLSDNVQKLKIDSLFYTHPITKELPDGSQQFNFAWGISMSKKEIVISMED